MDYTTLATKLISLFSKENELLSSVLPSLIEGETGEKILKLLKDKDESGLSSFLNSLSDDQNSLLQRIEEAIEMVERGEISTDDISQMIEKISGEKLNNILGNLGKLF